MRAEVGAFAPLDVEVNPFERLQARSGGLSEGVPVANRRGGPSRTCWNACAGSWIHDVLLSAQEVSLSWQPI